jgi:hypothetical protein
VRFGAAIRNAERFLFLMGSRRQNHSGKYWHDAKARKINDEVERWLSQARQRADIVQFAVEAGHFVGFG